MASLGTSAEGLSSEEASHRLTQHGPNLVFEKPPRSPLGLLAAQFGDFMILVLLAAAVVAGMIGDLGDAIAIVAIVFINAAIGFAQEYRAERAMAALGTMAAPTATVVRNGRSAVIPAAEVVRGDIVLLEAGRIVPADLRLLEVAHLRVDEAPLTGESVPVEKITALLDDATLDAGARPNMAYAGTIVTGGRGRGMAVATGMATEFGRIAALLQEGTDGRTPLQRRLAQFGRRLALAILVICAIVFAGGLARGEAPLLVLLTAVSLAVAAIPEALPAVVTISLALGARAMVAKHALVRRLPAVETLGSVTWICSDKTGTLTENRMRVEVFHCGGRLERVAAAGEPWDALVRAMALSNDAGPDATGRVVGDPTEVAFFEAARAAGVDRESAEKDSPRLAEIPFDPARRCMTTVHRDRDGGVRSYTKGAPEVVLERSACVLTAAGPIAVNRERLLATSERMAAEGLRVLAVATRRWPTPPVRMTPESLEHDLTLLGLVGLIDPPRPEAREAIAMCRAAGIVAVMITGDHPLTAGAIARRLGIVGDDAPVMTGDELATLSRAELATRVKRVRVFARVTPEQKLNIVTALQDEGQIVAMTGDGVNDAPALRQADIGVAMGPTGTDVAKEASAMILLDGNFATIVQAVREGRRIYDNLRKFIRYVLTTNSAEIWTIFLAPFLGLPIPLLPIQILWINLVTDGLPGLALSIEPEEDEIMRRPPRAPGETVFAHGLGAHAIWVGVLMAGLTLGTQAWFFHAGSPRWQTMAFTVLCFSSLGHVLAVRSERMSLLTLGVGSNTPLLGAVVLTVALQLATIYVPALNDVFATEPLTAAELAVAVAVAGGTFAAVEVEKWVKRRRTAKGGEGWRAHPWSS